MKLHELVRDISVKNVLHESELPHAHLLVILKNDIVPQDFDK